MKTPRSVGDSITHQSIPSNGDLEADMQWMSYICMISSVFGRGHSLTYHLRPHSHEKSMARFRPKLFFPSHLDELYCTIDMGSPSHNIRSLRRNRLEEPKK